MKFKGKVNEVGAVIVDRHARIVGDGIIVELEDREQLKSVEVYSPAIVLTDMHVVGYEEDQRAIKELVTYLARANLLPPGFDSPIDIALAELRKLRDASGLSAVYSYTDKFLADVAQELHRARGKHPPMHSMHEAFAVILEEVDELKAHVWKKQSERDPKEVYTELVHVAAMCARCIADCSSDQFKK